MTKSTSDFHSLCSPFPGNSLKKKYQRTILNTFVQVPLMKRVKQKLCFLMHKFSGNSFHYNKSQEQTQTKRTVIKFVKAYTQEI